MYLPDKMPLTHEIAFTGKKIFALTEDGVIYGCDPDNHRLKTSSDWGETWTEIHTFPQQIRNVVVLSTGNIVVALGNIGTVWRSDENGENFTKVLDFEGSDAESFTGFGVSAYDNVIVLGEYGHEDARRMYLSTDYGASFSKIYESPMDITHIHDVAYDPYENLIWGSSGDGYPYNQIFFSADFGETWNYLREGLELRATGIIPLPDCVLFISDDHAERAVYRHDRGEGSLTKPLEPKKVYSPSPYYNAADPWNGSKIITYGKNAKTLFSWHEAGSPKTAAQLFATDNGREFTTIWSSNRIPIANTSIQTRCGLFGVYGPTSNNEILVEYRSDESTGFLHGIKIQL